MPVRKESDHAKNCGVKNWYRSEKYVDLYVKIPAVRATISFASPVSYVYDGNFLEAKPDIELFSGMGDVQFKFASQSKIVLKTTGFTRIRLPVVVRQNNGQYTERIIFMTSHDRTIVAANSSRNVNQANFLNGFEHSTPLLLLLSGGCVKLSVDVNSGGMIHKYAINVPANGEKFEIPDIMLTSHRKRHVANKPFRTAKANRIRKYSLRLRIVKSEMKNFSSITDKILF